MGTYCAQFAVCRVTTWWPPTSAELATRTIANRQPPPGRRRASNCGVWTSVMLHLCRCRRRYRCTIAASPLWSGWARVGTTSAQSAACVYGYARPACHQGDIDHQLLINYYKTNIEYEKNLSLTSLVSTVVWSSTWSCADCNPAFNLCGQLCSRAICF